MTMARVVKSGWRESRSIMNLTVVCSKSMEGYFALISFVRTAS